MIGSMRRLQIDRLTRLIAAAATRLDGHDTDIGALETDVAALETGAGLRVYAITVTDAAYTAALRPVILCNCASNAITVTLPAASNGRLYWIKKVDSTANAVVIDGNGAETIDGAATQTLSYQWSAALVVSDGANWYIV